MDKKSILNLLMKETVAFVTESGDEIIYGSDEHMRELDDLIAKLRRVKQALKVGKDRHRNRKEVHRIQGAVESIRFLRRKAERACLKNSIMTEGATFEDYKKDISDATRIYSELIDLWGSSLKEKHVPPVISMRELDLNENIKSDVVFLVGVLKSSEVHEELLCRKYQSLFLEFIDNKGLEFVDVEKTHCLSSPMSAIIRVPSQRLIHVEAVTSFLRPGDEK